jgi:hypothetical protein
MNLKDLEESGCILIEEQSLHVPGRDDENCNQISITVASILIKI